MKKIVTVCLVASTFICGNVLPAAEKTGSNFQLPGQVFIVTKGQQTFKLPLVQVFAVPEAIISKAIASRAADRSGIRRNLTPQIIEKQQAIDQARAESKADVVLELSRQVVDFMSNCNGLGEMAFVNCMNNPALAELKSRADEARKAEKPNTERLMTAHREYRDLAIEYKNQRDAFKFFDGIESDIAAASIIVKTDADGNFNIEAPRGKRIAIFARAKRQVIGETEDYLWLVWAIPTNAKKIMLSNDNLIESQCSECISFREGIEWNKEVAKSIKARYPEFPDDRP
jgi:hypothetical protein